MNIKINNKNYRINYIVKVLYNKYKFESLDYAETFVRYCIKGCTDIIDLSNVTINIQYEEVNDDRETD